MIKKCYDIIFFNWKNWIWAILEMKVEYNSNKVRTESDFSCWFERNYEFPVWTSHEPRTEYIWNFWLDFKFPNLCRNNFRIHFTISFIWTMNNRSCVRRLRVEKKVHTLVLLRVWAARPRAAGASTSGKITLTSPAGANLARFPARRVLFCGAYADDARFFGLVTSASNTSTDSDSGSDTDADKLLKPRHNSAGNRPAACQWFIMKLLLSLLGRSFNNYCFITYHSFTILSIIISTSA